MNQLGINPILLLAQIINFGVLFFVLYRAVFKTILESIQKREGKEAETKRLQAEIEKKLENIEKLRQEKLAETRKEAVVILAQARDEAEKEKQTIITKAKKEAKEIIEEGKLEVAKKEEEMVKKLKTSSVAIAYEMARKLIKESVDSSSQRFLIEKAIKSLKRMKS